MNKTIEYYNQNAKSYFDYTINGNMEDYYKMFLKYLNIGDYILDFGCGSGRDTKYFLDNGYKVDAMDGSKKLCTLATAYTGIDVRCMDFLNLKEENTYDGIWAMSSLLHLDKKEFLKVLEKVYRALKIEGILYMSLKDGYSSEYDEKGRYYSYYTLEEIINITTNVLNFKLLEYKSNSSTINPDETKQWHNFILERKK